MKFETAFAAAMALVVFLGLGCFFNGCFEDSVQQDCLNSGRVVINHTVYACQKIGPEVKP